MSKKKKGKKGRKEAFDPEKDTGILRPVDMTIAAEMCIRDRCCKWL